MKGFALMLLIGTVISLGTAVAATRAMLGLLADFSWFDNPRFMGATSAEIPKWQRWDVVGRRRLWFILSLAAIGISIIALLVQGLNLGIDFKGGVQMTFNTPKAVAISTVRDQTAAIGHGDAIVQGRGSSVNGDQYKSWQIRLKKLTPDEQANLTNTLQDKLDAAKLGVKNVSSSFSRQILRSAILAIIVSFALIALYVTLRYQWRFAVPILRTLVNDVLITLGVYAISGREVSASTVAAVLTILGFSIYDTIIVFDRVRENMRLMPRASIARICNVSVWEVLRRSFFTSVITLLPIAALYVFGGPTLQDFAFAIMVGIVIGAVGTIFIATPLLATLLEREPEYARRKALEQSEAESLRASEDAIAADPAPQSVREILDPEHEPALVTGPRMSTRTTRATSRTAKGTATRATALRTPSGSGGVSVERRGRMDEPADRPPEPKSNNAPNGHNASNGVGSTEPSGFDDAGSTDPPDNPDSIERLLALVGPRVDEVRSLIGDSTSRWRGDALRVGEGTRHRLRDVFRELGLVTADDWDELELRVAQLEHRIGLLEKRADEAEAV